MSKANELRALIALAEKATPGPWVTDRENNGRTPISTETELGPLAWLQFASFITKHEDDDATKEGLANVAYFVACSPDKLIPLLTAAAEAMEREEEPPDPDWEREND